MSKPQSTTPFVTLWRRLAPELRQERRLVVIGSFFVVLSSATTLTYPWIVRMIIDKGIIAGNADMVSPLAYLMMGILVVESIAVMLLFYCFGIAGRRTVERLRVRLMGHLLEQEIAFFDRESSSVLMTRVMNDLRHIMDLISHPIPAAIRQVFMLVAGSVLVVYSAPLLALTIAVIWPLVAWGTSKLGSRMRTTAADVQTAESQVAAAALEALEGIRTVRAYAQEKAEVSRFQGFVEASIQRARSNILAISQHQGFLKLTTEAAVVGGVWIGGQLIISGRLSPGALVSFILYAGLVVRSARDLSSFHALILRIYGTTEDIFSYLDRDTRMNIEGGDCPDEVHGDLRFENVTFHYDQKGGDEHPHGLEAVNVLIERGEELAIVGPSGSGKSTLMRLAGRFYDPDGGRVTFDGNDLRDLDPGWLRHRVALIAQDSSLFARTLEENLRYGRADADDLQVSTAVSAVGATTLVESQPLGLETNVGDHGARLSGGQRQRIALARALIGEPAVLILDEATSAVDAEGEARIKESLRKLAYRPTVIWVAHRLSTVVDVPRILMVDRGHIIADGSHTELLGTSKKYRDLVETQLVSE